MRLGDFRKETEKLSDDYILDDVMFIEDLPGYWDGYLNECKNHKRILRNEQKIRCYMYDSRTKFWDYCDKNKSYHTRFLVVILRLILKKHSPRNEKAIPFS